jgi:phospholipid/cholesterol/gamma-HCH transport system substrate-binding protein
MITKEQKIRLGVFLVASFFLLVVIVTVFILPKLKNIGDIYYIDFKEMSVNGVNEGADVKYQGVKIGNVVRLVVNPDDLRSVLIYVRIKKGFRVKKNMRAALQYAGITGLRFVEISGGTTEAEDLEPGGKILTKRGLGEKAEDIVLNVDSVVEALNNILDTENREKISLLIKNLEKSTAVIANVLEKREKNLGNSLADMDKITRQLSQVTANLNEFTLYLKDISEKIQAGRIEKMVTQTETLLENLSNRLSDREMGKLVADIDTFARTATTSLQKIERRFHDLEGNIGNTLGSLRESLANIARFTRDLSEDPTIFIRKRPQKRQKKE